MCGIFWAKLLSEDTEAYKTAFYKIKHRGPDGSEFVIKDNQAIGFHWLHVVRPGKIQPFTYEEWTVVCNGELYKAPSNLESDCELMLDACDMYDKTSFLRNVDGDFAVVWASADNVCAARDPIGLCPLFFAQDEKDNIIAFASEAKAIVGLPSVSRVEQFPPGHWWSSDHNSFMPYTDVYTGVPRTHCSTTDITSYVSTAIEKRLNHGNVPVAILCSGGIDSSIVACVARNYPNLRAFSVVFDSPNGRSEDVAFAKTLLGMLKIKHEVVTFTEKDIQENLKQVVYHCETTDPVTIRAAIPMFLLAKHISTNTDIKVILSGEGADELFMGYSCFDHAPTGFQANQESKRLTRNIHSFDLLRAERCFSAFGLEVRTPFLDKDVIKYSLSLAGELRFPKNFVEKFILRDAFKHFEELHNSKILFRMKQRMSDGVSCSYVPSLLRMLSDAKEKSLPLHLMEKKEKETYESNLPFKAHMLPRTTPNWKKEQDNSPLNSFFSFVPEQPLSLSQG